jgi:type III secretion protein N (ATPase)
MPAVTSEAHQAAASRLRALLAAHDRHRDLIAVGAYRRGTDPDTDAALDRMPAIEAFLRQAPSDREELDATLARLAGLVA